MQPEQLVQWEPGVDMKPMKLLAANIQGAQMTPLAYWTVLPWGIQGWDCTSISNGLLRTVLSHFMKQSPCTSKSLWNPQAYKITCLQLNKVTNTSFKWVQVIKRKGSFPVTSLGLQRVQCCRKSPEHCAACVWTFPSSFGPSTWRCIWHAHERRDWCCGWGNCLWLGEMWKAGRASSERLTRGNSCCENDPNFASSCWERNKRLTFRPFEGMSLVLALEVGNV